MQTLTDAAQYVTEALALLLIFRLLCLPERGSRLYGLFAFFLSIQLVEALGYFACVHWKQLDYRTIWVTGTIVAVLYSPVLVYFLLKAVLAEIPGVLQFSQRLLLVIFPLALIAAFSTARLEFGAVDKQDLHTPLGRLISFFMVIDKGTSLVIVIVLVAILAFILWFPVKMSRNLAIFSVGFIVYFTAKSGLSLISFYSPINPGTRGVLSLVTSLVGVACLAYWLIFINSKGESISVRMGHSWHVSEQTKLIDRLESMNGILLKSAHRLQQ